MPSQKSGPPRLPPDAAADSHAPEHRKRKRPAPISYRPPKGREAEFLARVAESGLSVNAFINARVFRRDRRLSLSRAEAALLLHHAARLRDNLDRIEDSAGDDAGSARLLAAFFADLELFRAVLLQAMRRRP
jgi:hypothetical protein